MTLGWKLFIVFLAFLTILAIVVYMAFRERRLDKSLGDDVAGQQASDARVLAVIFSAIFGGMFLALVAGWLVFL